MTNTGLPREAWIEIAVAYETPPNRRIYLQSVLTGVCLYHASKCACLHEHGNTPAGSLTHAGRLNLSLCRAAIQRLCRNELSWPRIGKHEWRRKYDYKRAKLARKIADETAQITL
jgi:hypothetical protein